MDALIPLALPALTVAWTAWRSRAIERAHPPEGDFVDTRAGRIHVLDRGYGKTPVVFLHGASSNLRTWEPAIGYGLGNLGRTILLDRPGHGFSERIAGRGAASLEHQAGAVIDVLDELGIDQAVMVAHSWAGALGARLGLDHPDRVAGLLMLAPVTHPWPGGVSWYYEVAARPVIGELFTWTLTLPVGEMWMQQGMKSVFAPQSIPEAYQDRAAIPLVLRPHQFRANAEDCASLLAEVTAQAPRYGEITCPMTVISGTDDAVVWTHLHSHGLKADVPHAKLILLDGIGHAPHHAKPELVLTEVASMLAEVA